MRHTRSACGGRFALCAGGSGVGGEFFALRGSALAVRGTCAGPDGLGNLQLLAKSGFQLVANVRVFLEEDAGVLAALAHALPGKAEPSPAFFYDALIHTEVDEVAFAGDTFAVKDVEFGFAEGSGNLVFHDFAARARADHPVALLDGLDAADIDAHRGVELERTAARGGFRIAEHDADLFADLVDEDEAGARLRDNRGEFAQRLRHQPRLQAHRWLTHFALELGLRDQRCNRVHDDTVHGARPDQCFGDFEGLLAVVGLGDEQIVHVHAELAGVTRVERVLGVNEGCLAAELLGFGNDVEGESRLAAGFGAVDFDHAAAGKAADAQSGVEREATRGNHVHGDQDVPVAQAHDRAFAVALLDLRDRRIQ